MARSSTSPPRSSSTAHRAGAPQFWAMAMDVVADLRVCSTHQRGRSLPQLHEETHTELQLDAYLQLPSRDGMRWVAGWRSSSSSSIRLLHPPHPSTPTPSPACRRGEVLLARARAPPSLTHSHSLLPLSPTHARQARATEQSSTCSEAVDRGGERRTMVGLGRVPEARRQSECKGGIARARAGHPHRFPSKSPPVNIGTILHPQQSDRPIVTPSVPERRRDRT